MKINIHRNTDTPLPKYQTEGAAAVDLHSTVDTVLQAKKIISIPIGLRFEIPQNYELQIRQRGSLAKKGIIIPNAPGTIDSDFRGEVFVLLLNTSTEDFEIKIGDRVAQAVLNKFEKMEFVENEKLSETERGEGALGSTGV